MAATARDRRREPRVTLRSNGIIDLGDRMVPCKTVDLSERGLGLVAPVGAPMRSVRVRIRLAEYAPWTDVEGRVVHCVAHGGEQFWGLELHPTDPGTETRVRNYVRSHTRPGAAPVSVTAQVTSPIHLFGD